MEYCTSYEKSNIIDNNFHKKKIAITNQKRVYKRKRNTSFLLKEIHFQSLVAQLFFAKIIINNVRFFIIGAILIEIS